MSLVKAYWRIVALPLNFKQMLLWIMRISRMMGIEVRYLQLPNFRWQVCLSWGKVRRSITQDAVNDTLKDNILKHVSAKCPLWNVLAVQHGSCIQRHIRLARLWSVMFWFGIEIFQLSKNRTVLSVDGTFDNDARVNSSWICYFENKHRDALQKLCTERTRHYCRP